MMHSYKLTGNALTVEVEVQDNGVTIWSVGDDGKRDAWIIDASTIVNDGSVTISTEYLPLTVNQLTQLPRAEFEIVPNDRKGE